MLIKFFGNIFWLKKFIYNIVLGNLFPVLTNPSNINDPSANPGGFLFDYR
jgi:hypothetical protein